MPVLNSNNEAPLWWQTALHVIFAPIVFFLLFLLIGSFMYIFGHFDSILGFISRGFQSWFAAYFALVAPTLILKKSNESVACIIFGTLMIAALVTLFLITELLVAPKHELFEWLELGAEITGIFTGAAAYYFGSR